MVGSRQRTDPQDTKVFIDAYLTAMAVAAAAPRTADAQAQTMARSRSMTCCGTRGRFAA